MLSWLLVWRNLGQSRGRTLLTALAVALGVAVVVASSVMSSGMRAHFDSSGGMMDWVLDMIGVMFTAVGAVMLMAAGFLIFNAFAMSVTQYRRQIGLLRAVGMTQRQVLRQIIGEAMLTSGIGVGLGLLLGPLLGYGLLWVIELAGVEVGRGKLSAATVILGIVLGLVISWLSVYFPAKRAMRISPLAALRAEAAVSQSRSARRSTLISFGIILPLWIYLRLAPPGEWSGHHPPWDLLLPGLLILPWLVAVGLLVPEFIALTSRLVRWVQRFVSGAMLRLIADNLGRDRRRVTLTVLTFAVSIIMIVAMNGILVFSNDVLLIEAAQASLDQTAWFIFSFDRTQGLGQLDEMNNAMLGIGGITPIVSEDIRQITEGRAVVTEVYMVNVPQIGSPFEGFPVSITSLYSITKSGSYSLIEGDWETAVPIMEQGCGLLLPPSVAARNGVGVGDPLSLPGREGPVDCVLAGIITGGIAPLSMISMAAKDQFTTHLPTSLSIWPLPDANLKDLDNDLHALVERHAGDAFLTLPDDELHAVLDTSDQLEGMTNGLLVLGIITASLGMVNTTVMSVADRRRELGLLRAAGASRRQIVQIVLGEAGLIGIIGGLLGVLAGSGMTAIFALGRGGISFGLIDLDLWDAAWRSVAPALLPGLLGVAFLAVVSAIAAWFPIRTLLRASTIDIMESNRRLKPQGRRGGKAAKE